MYIIHRLHPMPAVIDLNRILYNRRSFAPQQQGAPDEYTADRAKNIVTSAQQAKSCGVFTTGGIGDHLFDIPFFWSLRHSYPHMHILDITMQPKVASLCLKAGLVDRVVVVSNPREPGADLKRRQIRFLLETLQLRCLQLDLSIFLATGLTSKLALWQACVGARCRVATGPSIVKNHRWLDYIEPGSATHHIDQDLVLAESLGCDTSNALMSFQEVFAQYIRERAGEGGVFIHPFLMDYTRDGRRWSLRNFQAVHEYLDQCGIEPVVLGTERELSRPELRAWPNLKTATLSSLEDSARLLAGARLVIGNDSAVVHLASLLGSPALCVMGSSDPYNTRPYFGGGVARIELPCSPCFSKKGFLTCNHFSCVERLSPDLVIAHPLVQELFSGTRITRQAPGGP